ncbi:MAG TPA: hypothetical protein VG326_10305 [Tepidisphaeraceae bacterium]|nr:hypothetical protein [Tepidisphaeraceae bacterium]
MNHENRVVAVAVFQKDYLDQAVALAAASHDPLLVTGLALAIPANLLSRHGFDFTNGTSMPGCIFQVPFIPTKCPDLHRGILINKMGDRPQVFY